MTFYYLLFIWGDVEPELLGPFGSEEQRDNTALELRAQHGRDAGGFYKADFTLKNADGVPALSIDSYTGAFFAAIDGDDDEASILSSLTVLTRSLP